MGEAVNAADGGRCLGAQGLPKNPRGPIHEKVEAAKSVATMRRRKGRNEKSSNELQIPDDDAEGARFSTARSEKGWRPQIALKPKVRIRGLRQTLATVRNRSDEVGRASGADRVSELACR